LFKIAIGYFAGFECSATGANRSNLLQIQAKLRILNDSRKADFKTVMFFNVTRAITFSMPASLDRYVLWICASALTARRTLII
jgi:hypothetical protein